MPGEAYTLFYDDQATVNGEDTPLSITYVLDGRYPQITIWTDESDLYLADGTEAVTDHNF
jgi:hypothetical protein